MRTLRELAEAYAQLRSEAREYFDVVLNPQLESCATRDEADRIRIQVAHEATAEDGAFRGLPAEIEIALLLAIEERFPPETGD
jgi:hypothetical protein